MVVFANCAQMSVQHALLWGTAATGSKLWTDPFKSGKSVIIFWCPSWWLLWNML